MKIQVITAILVVILLVGCSIGKPADFQPSGEQQQQQEQEAEGSQTDQDLDAVASELDEIDSIDEELDVSDFDTLDEDLDIFS